MIRAYQVDPKYQESYFEIDFYPGVIITGNRHFNSHIPDKLADLFQRFDGSRVLRALRIVTGKKYHVRLLTGCCQSDWQYAYYPSEDYTHSELTRLETEYFNLGTEWDICDGTDNFCHYSCEHETEAIRKEIQEITGEKPENIKLFEFDGYTKTPKYREV